MLFSLVIRRSIDPYRALFPLALLLGALRLGLLVSLSGVLAAVGWVPERIYFALSAVLCLFLATYFARRWLARSHHPPASFLFALAVWASVFPGKILRVVKEGSLQ